MIYLDNAATTKPNARALDEARAYLTERYFNPSALYREGFELHLELKAAREHILSCLADPAAFELIFTSCGTVRSRRRESTPPWQIRLRNSKAGE